MSEVMRWKLKGFLPGVEGMCKAVMRPEVVMASDFDAAQSELAALREELASANRSAETLHEVIGRLKSERDAAEQRNALMSGFLVRMLKGNGNDLLAAWQSEMEMVLVDAALKPIESGASE